MAVGLNAKGQGLWDAWAASVAALQQAQDAFNAAMEVERTARNKFGKWMSPDDMKPMDRVSVIVGRTQIDCYLQSDGDFNISTRKREKADDA